uniref:Serpentine Receptor, class H n=1 Tax=Caenorhabditis tropicalis TaxID=1561998 RepID=A0A1I7UBB8_9PELO
MCSISLEIDERHFYIVENFKPMSQIITMLLVNFVSIGVNLVMFYVTILNSKNESTLYRLVSFIHNFSLFLAQFYWGFILNPIPLLPLPGVQSIGVLRGTLRNSTYFLIFLIIFTLVFFPILSRILPFYQSEEAMKNHLLQYYPKCVSLANHPGFFVFVNTCQSKKGVFVVLILLFGGASLYLVVCAIIIYEIKMQSYAWNVNKTKNHIKVLKHTIVQNIFRFLFLAIAPAIVLRNTFLPSEADTINITLFANAMFTAAPIPCAIVILTQNTTYRNFLLSRIYCFNRRAPSSSDSGSSRSSAPSTVFRQTTVL